MTVEIPHDSPSLVFYNEYIMAKKRKAKRARSAARGGKGGMMRLRGGMRRAAGTERRAQDADAKRWALIILGGLLVLALIGFGAR
jgi:hypothetical protein